MRSLWTHGPNSSTNKNSSNERKFRHGRYVGIQGQSSKLGVQSVVILKVGTSIDHGEGGDATKKKEQKTNRKRSDTIREESEKNQSVFYLS